jgi:hypothetical protein
MGICVLCNNLVRSNISLDGKSSECYRCCVKKFDQENIQSFWSLTNVSKPCKTIKDIQEKCDSWDDRLKPKQDVK